MPEDLDYLYMQYFDGKFPMIERMVDDTCILDDIAVEYWTNLKLMVKKNFNTNTSCIFWI